MVQVPGYVAGAEKGVTTIDQHENKTWGPAVAGTAAQVAPTLTDHPAIITYIKAIRNNRKDN